MKIKIKYFAMMRECAGTSEETIDENISTPSGLLTFLKAKHSFDIAEESLKVAVNGEYADFSKQLSEFDTVAFIPPVAGG